MSSRLGKAKLTDRHQICISLLGESETEGEAEEEEKEEGDREEEDWRRGRRRRWEEKWWLRGRNFIVDNWGDAHNLKAGGSHDDSEEEELRRGTTGRKMWEGGGGRKKWKRQNYRVRKHILLSDERFQRLAFSFFIYVPTYRSSDSELNHQDEVEEIFAFLLHDIFPLQWSDKIIIRITIGRGDL